MQFIDSHAHLTDSTVMPHADAMIERAKNKGVSHIVNICTDKKTLEDGLLLAKKNPSIKNAGATTPHDVVELGKEFELFKNAAAHLCAIGETGLDYHYEHSPKKIQQEYLVRYLHLAMESKLPVIFHCREAFVDLFSITDQEYKGPAILHCFTGTLDEAEKVLERGWYLSLSGIVTFKKSIALQEVAKMVPLSQLLIETDTPYLAPQSQRGKMNEPSYIPEIAEMIARLKGIPLEEVAKATFENGKRVFGYE